MLNKFTWKYPRHTSYDTVWRKKNWRYEKDVLRYLDAEEFYKNLFLKGSSLLNKPTESLNDVEVRRVKIDWGLKEISQPMWSHINLQFYEIIIGWKIYKNTDIWTNFDNNSW